jgi:hypothetical protein
MLDLDINRAYWFSAAGEQSIDLGQPLHRPAENIATFPDWLIAASRAADQAGDPIPETLSTPAG